LFEQVINDEIYYLELIALETQLQMLRQDDEIYDLETQLQMLQQQVLELLEKIFQ
jgi:hypothetical protein